MHFWGGVKQILKDKTLVLFEGTRGAQSLAPFLSVSWLLTAADFSVLRVDDVCASPAARQGSPVDLATRLTTHSVQRCSSRWFLLG